MSANLDLPALILDKTRCLRNIDRMVSKAVRAGISLRPHFKTHQSQIVGHWFRDFGIKAITTSSLSMAEYFAADGWDDITVAFPVNLRESARINRLTKSLKINLLVQSVEVIEALDNMVSDHTGVYLKIDVGTQRTGIELDDMDEMDRCVESILRSRNLQWKGFLAHAGHTYGARSPADVENIYHDTTGSLIQLKERYCTAVPGIIGISYGDTPSCTVMDSFPGLDEIRPGNFVFYDCMQVQIGVCTPQDIAVAMSCPVVAVHPKRNELIVYGGGIHFGKDAICNDDGSIHYGIAVQQSSDGWVVGEEEAYLKSLSQEHGVVHMPQGIPQRMRPGGTMMFLPVHSCMAAQCMGAYLVMPSGEKADHYASAMHRS